jgi:TATA-box binding protein (TBP) (component of TFIID and TFIIIB)
VIEKPAPIKGYKFSNKRAKIKVKQNLFMDMYFDSLFGTDNYERESDESLEMYDSIYFPQVNSLLYIVNVVGSYRLGVGFNPKKIAMYMRDISVKYFAPKFAAATIIVQAPNIPKTTVHLFGTGKAVQAGALTKGHCIAGARLVENYLNRKFQCEDIQMTDFDITNMVGKLRIGGPIDIRGLNESLGVLAKLTVKFPACRIRLDLEDNKVCLAFDSGKLVFTGFRNKEVTICDLFRSNANRTFSFMYHSFLS